MIYLRKAAFCLLLIVTHFSSFTVISPKNTIFAFDMHNVFMIEGKPSFFRKLLYDQPYFMMDTVQFIKQLKKEGYPVFVLTNCPKEGYDRLCTIFSSIFGLFDGAYMPSKANGYNHKPKASFYKEFKTYVAARGHSSKQIIFIDDLKQNILAAEKEGMLAIQFKTITQVKTDISHLLYA